MIVIERNKIVRSLYDDTSLSEARKNYLNDIRIFDSMTHRPISYYLPYEDLIALNMLYVKPKYGSKTKSEKFEISDFILGRRGFARVVTGTNRVVYRHTMERFMLKIALDSIGVSDNRAEYRNQYFLKPFVPKVFDVSIDGVVQLVEEVIPIKHADEFRSVAGDIFDILHIFILGEFILDDIGTNFPKNWGVRPGFGPVLLDYPYLFKLMPERLKCPHIDLDTGHRCTGVIDYDAGLNFLKCNKCGLRFRARDLGKLVKDEDIQNDIRRQKLLLSNNYNPYDRVVIEHVDKHGRVVEESVPKCPEIPVDRNGDIKNEKVVVKEKVKEETRAPSVDANNEKEGLEIKKLPDAPPEEEQPKKIKSIVDDF